MGGAALSRHEPRLLAGGFRSLEAPVVDRDGGLLFADLKTGLVHRLTATGDVEQVAAARPHAGGMALHAGGGLVLSGTELLHLEAGGGARTLLLLEDVAVDSGIPVAFNDLAASPDGSVLVGVLAQDAAGNPAPGVLVQVTAPRTHHVVLAGVHPNGIAYAPDGQVVLADTYGRRLLWLEAGDSPSTVVRAVDTSSLRGLPDGVAVDVRGEVWVAFYRGAAVVRFGSDGRVRRRVRLPFEKALSVCLHPSRPWLYVTTGEDQTDTGSVLRLVVDAPGARVYDATV